MLIAADPVNKNKTELVHDKTYNKTCATSKNSDQSVQSDQSLC